MGLTLTPTPTLTYAKIFCLVHKMDLIPEEQRDPVFRQRERELMRLAQPLGTVRVRVGVRDKVRVRDGVRVWVRLAQPLGTLT